MNVGGMKEMPLAGKHLNSQQCWIVLNAVRCRRETSGGRLVSRRSASNHVHIWPCPFGLSQHSRNANTKAQLSLLYIFKVSPEFDKNKLNRCTHTSLMNSIWKAISPTILSRFNVFMASKPVIEFLISFQRKYS